MIRIGTRKSSLAIWQANHVKSKLEKLGFACTLVTLKSSGDQDLIQPLYSMCIQGIFTKTLDHALLNGSIDIAVHSLKDVPTLLPEGIIISAYLERGAVNDIMVYHKDFINWQKNTQIGTGSLRRRAQWLRKYPHHSTENLRGNLQKRLNKLNAANWGGAIFAQAGLERLNLLRNKFTVLDWMIPAPGQGIISVASLEKNKALTKFVQTLNCKETQLADYGYFPTAKKGEYLTYETESDLRDTENVPLKENIYDYFIREVKPHVEEAWINLDATKIGY